MGSFLLSLMTFVAFFMAPVASPGTTRYEVGPGRMMRDFAFLGTGSGSNPSVAHKPSGSNWFAVDLPILGDAAATGSSTVKSTGPTGVQGTKYAAICIPNPFRKMGTGTGSTYFNTGSGGVISAVYRSIKNPAAMGGDLGFVHSCSSGTGNDLITDVSTATGGISVYFSNATTMKVIQGADFIKLGLRGDPTPSFRASLYLDMMNASADH